MDDRAGTEPWCWPSRVPEHGPFAVPGHANPLKPIARALVDAGPRGRSVVHVTQGTVAGAARLRDAYARLDTRAEPLRLIEPTVTATTGGR